MSLIARPSVVIYRLIERSKTALKYFYYPEGKKTRKPGIIEMVSGHMQVTKLASGDTDISPAVWNGFADLINNRLKHERGATDFLPQETNPRHIIFYGDQAVDDIMRRLDAGEIPESGRVAWF